MGWEPHFDTSDQTAKNERQKENIKSTQRKKDILPKTSNNKMEGWFCNRNAGSHRQCNDIFNDERKYLPV